MTTRRIMAAGLTMAIVIVLGANAFAGWWDKADDAQPVNFEKVLQNPDAYRGKEITFDCVFQEVSTIYNPYYTRFVPSEYVNFSVWPATRQLWREKDYMANFSFLFLERGHKNYNQLMAMKKYTRLRLTGYVQNTFKNVPWIEVRFVEVLDGALTKSSLRQIILGDDAAKAGKWDEALKRWTAAKDQQLPPDVLASVELKRGQAYMALGRREEAKALLAELLQTDPNNDAVRDLMARLDPAALPARTDTPSAEAPAKSEEPAAIARPVDPNRYPPIPKAMPVPEEKPAPEQKAEEPTEPASETESAPETEPPAETEPKVEMPPKTEGETPAVEAQPKAGDQPDSGNQTEPVPPAVEEKPAPEKPAEPPAKDPVPKKRMSGPM